MEFLAAHLLEIIFGLIAAGALAFCKYLGSQVKYFKKLNEEKSDAELIEKIQEEIKPIVEEIHRLQKRIEKLEDYMGEELGIILESYKFRLVQLCKKYLKQQYLTQDQYDQLSEFFKVYSSLGGNGQAAEYYERAIELPIQ